MPDKPVDALTLPQLMLQRARKRRSRFKTYHLRMIQEYKLLEQNLRARIEHLQTHGGNSHILLQHEQKRRYYMKEINKHVEKLRTGIVREYHRSPEVNLDAEAAELAQVELDVSQTFTIEDLYPEMQKEREAEVEAEIEEQYKQKHQDAEYKRKVAEQLAKLQDMLRDEK
jgi:hypothetical protein